MTDPAYPLSGEGSLVHMWHDQRLLQHGVSCQRQMCTR